MTLLACPACGADKVTVGADGMLVCERCGTRLPVPLNPCPSCGHLNLPDVEQCAVCSEPLSLVARVVNRQLEQPSAPWLDRVRAQAPSLKEGGQAASESRMAVFRHAEQMREEELRRLSALRAQQDRKIVLVAAAIALVLLFSLTLAALIIAF